MNQAELVKTLVNAASLSNKEAEGILKKLGDVVAAELIEGGEVTLTGIGKLDPYDRLIAAAMLRRAIIVGCAMLAASLGM